MSEYIPGSTRRLVRDLKAKKDPRLDEIIRQALAGYYHEETSPLDYPHEQLAEDLRSFGYDELAQWADAQIYSILDDDALWYDAEDEDSTRSLLVDSVGESRAKTMVDALRIMFETGYSVAMEIREKLEWRRGVAPGNKAIKRAVMSDLPTEGLIRLETFRFIGQSKLALVRPTKIGVMLGRFLGLGEPVESEWERVIRLHRGNEWERHTLGVLAFAWQARRWGCHVELMPGGKIDGPDGNLCHLDGYPPIYWEFETRARGREEKWKQWAERGREFGVCTFSPGARREILRELKKAGTRGSVIDLQTLCQTSDPDMLDWWGIE